MLGKLYFTYKNGAHQGTYTVFEEAAGKAYGWDIPAIVCKGAGATSADGDMVFRVGKAGDRWIQSYPDGRERDVTERMATMAKLDQRSKVRGR
jgi:hypothetical protein